MTSGNSISEFEKEKDWRVRTRKMMKWEEKAASGFKGVGDGRWDSNPNTDIMLTA